MSSMNSETELDVTDWFFSAQISNLKSLVVRTFGFVDEGMNNRNCQGFQ